MSETNPSSLDVLQDLDTRQDDLLSQLDELNGRVEAVLEEFGAGTSKAPADSASADPVEADVECSDAVGECTDADPVDSRVSDGAESLESDAS